MDTTWAPMRHKRERTWDAEGAKTCTKKHMGKGQNSTKKDHKTQKQALQDPHKHKEACAVHREAHYAWEHQPENPVSLEELRLMSVNFEQIKAHEP